MDVEKGKAEYTFDVKLAKYLGIFDILDTDNTTRKFGYNVNRIIIKISGLYIFTIALSNMIDLYGMNNDVIVCSYYLGMSISYLLMCYKLAIILYRSNDLLECFAITNRTFLSYLHYNTKVFENWRERSIRIVYVYCAMVSVVCIFWISSPSVLSDTVVTTRLVDGSYSTRRTNIINVFLMVPDDMYNDHFNIFFLLEILSALGFIYSTVVCDNIMIIICIALSSQLDRINDGIASLGHESSPNDSSEYTDFVHVPIYNRSTKPYLTFPLNDIMLFVITIMN